MGSTFKSSTSSGTSKTDTAVDTCIDWKMCPEGAGISVEGTALADRQCTACVAGYNYSTVNDESACVDVDDFCAAGTYTVTAATPSNNHTCATCETLGWSTQQMRAHNTVL